MFEPWEIERCLEELPRDYNLIWFQRRLLEPEASIQRYIRRAEEWLTGKGDIT